jgi:ABC-2 type transport system permease protein
MLTWGFTSVYLTRRLTGTAAISHALVAAVLLTEIFMRTTQNILVLFLEEIWSRNLGHLFASPIKFREYALGLTLTSLLRAAIAVTPAFILASYLFNFSLLSLGWPLLPYIVLLALNGCWYGMLLMALMLRYGMAAEWLGWMATQLLVPLIAPYYPVTVLPHAIQLISWSLPATYIFEDMKTVIAGQASNPVNLWTSLALNFVFMVLAAFLLALAYRSARRKGGLLQVGE